MVLAACLVGREQPGAGSREELLEVGDGVGRARASWAAKLACVKLVVTATHVIPAARAARMPDGASSKAMQSEGGTPDQARRSQEDVGIGFAARDLVRACDQGEPRGEAQRPACGARWRRGRRLRATPGWP